jgi:uncharacterized short protein YbdD (DUF466 family)
MQGNRREGERRGEKGREHTSPTLSLSRLLSPVLALLGMPDYDAHCRHLREHHPERPLPSEREFFDQFVRARYGDGPTRCC